MKKTLSLLLAFCLLLTLAVPAFAADSMDNFQKVKTYENNFSDVPADHWAKSSVAACYEYGLMNGADAATFNLAGNLSVAEALVMAAQVHQIYKTGATSVQPSAEGAWYQSFVDYCVEAGIIKADDFSDFNAKATRAQMAGIFAHALPASGFSAIGGFTPPDVNADIPYRDEILTLYAAGVLSGSDSYGTFYPNNTISRAEAAVILSRIALPASRSAKVLLKDISLTHGITVAAPQDVVNVSDASNPNSVDYQSSTAMVSAMFEQDDLYRAIDIGYFGDLLNELLPAMMEEVFAEDDSVEIKSTNSTTVKFGEQNAMRMTCTAVSEGVTADMVIYLYTADDTMGMILLAAMDDAALANTMANSVRINGAGVSSTL